ncbi:CheY-like chemotaxis protein [Luteimonas terrae]|uniref:CheY-like chemotaxis protein n=1 Tax=Luteimonas terrae TaxID=1530191 RepID=A0ABU1Y0M9_9GAMM|nr:CheY-like chemotaxis protein [Luteimonas terrae]
MIASGIGRALCMRPRHAPADRGLYDGWVATFGHIEGQAMQTSRNDNGVVLIVEDDARLALLTGEWLVRRGYAIDYARDGIEALNRVAAQRYDAILLDVTLPRLGGIEVCRQLRAAAHTVTPILMLSALTTLEAKLAGLDAGADD